MATLGIALMPEFELQHFAKLARHVEKLGYSNLWVPDERFWRDMTVCMSKAILATETIKIGSSVTDPFVRHPALTAQLFASLDELSGGRIICGIGAGIAGFEAMGVKRKSPVTAIREATELMRLLWTGETVNYQGKIVRFNDASLDFSPPRADIPVYIAGRGPLVLSLAGEIAEGAIIGSLASEPGLNFALDRIDQGLAKNGRSRKDIEVTLWLHLAIDENSDAALDAVRMIVAGVLVSSLPILDSWGISLPSAVLEALDGVTYGVNSPGMKKASAAITPDVVRHFAVAGNPAQVRQQLARLVEAGINHFAALPWRTPNQSPERFASMLIDTASPIL